MDVSRVDRRGRRRDKTKVAGAAESLPADGDDEVAMEMSKQDSRKKQRRKRGDPEAMDAMTAEES